MDQLLHSQSLPWGHLHANFFFFCESWLKLEDKISPQYTFKNRALYVKGPEIISRVLSGGSQKSLTPLVLHLTPTHFAFF